MSVGVTKDYKLKVKNLHASRGCPETPDLKVSSRSQVQVSGVM